jgi:hypothetical protein
MTGGSDGVADVPARLSRARDLASRGQLDEALAILRALLYEDIDCGPAQAAVQEVRRAWLRRGSPAGGSMPAGGLPATVDSSRAVAAEPVSARPGTLPPVRVAPGARLPRSRAGTIAVLAIVVAVVAGFAARRRPTVSPPSTSGLAPAPPLARTTSSPPRASEAPGGQDDAGPLAGIDPALRDAIRETLTLYGRALQRADLALMAQARPDLSEEARTQAAAPFRGALNVTADLRVVEVAREGDRARVAILRTDVVRGGKGAEAPTAAETLRFRRRGGAWTLEK